MEEDEAHKLHSLFAKYHEGARTKRVSANFHKFVYMVLTIQLVDDMVKSIPVLPLPGNPQPFNNQGNACSNLVVCESCAGPRL